MADSQVEIPPTEAHVPQTEEMDTKAEPDSVEEQPVVEASVESTAPEDTEVVEEPPSDAPLPTVEKEPQEQNDKNIVAELEAAVRREVAARKELEEMLLRMEQHLRTEEESRKEAERQLDVSLENEHRLKKEIDDMYQQQTERERDLARQTKSLGTERASLQSMRDQMDQQLAAAREEAQKAVKDLQTAEDRVRSEERAEATKREAEFQKKISTLSFELGRVRQELIIRTKLLSEEMERWRQQAEFASAAVIEAKSEVTERKRDLDQTRDKMDRLMDKLHLGREHGLVLQASLTAANAYTTQAQRSLIQSMESAFQNSLPSIQWTSKSSLEEMKDPLSLVGPEVKSAKKTASGAKERPSKPSRRRGR